MIEPNTPYLSVGKHCKPLSISWSSFHSQPKDETVLNLMLMRQIDGPFLEVPLCGVRQMAWHWRKFEGAALAR